MCLERLAKVSEGDVRTTYLPTVGLVVDFVEGDRAASARCNPVLIDVSLNDLLVLVALLAPYRDEKLSPWRGFRENMIAVERLKLAMTGIDCRRDCFVAREI